MASKTGLLINRVQRTVPYCGCGEQFGAYSGCPRGSSSYQIITLRSGQVRSIILRSGTSRAPTIMSLIRYLCLLAARHSFCFTASPVSEKCNPIADSLSRFQSQRFRRLASDEDRDQTQIPRQLLLT